MAYSFQSFVFNQIFTSTAANQIEVNIRDHVHGHDNVAPSGLNFSQTAKTGTYSVNGTSDNGELFRAGAGSSDMDLDLPDASTAGDNFAVHGLNDNDLQGSTEIGSVNFDPAGTDIITEQAFTNWPVSPGEMGSMISSNGIWYPFGFPGLHPIGIVNNSDTAVFIVPRGWAIVLAYLEEISRASSSGAINLQTRISGGSFNTGTTLDLGTAPNGSGYRALVMLFNIDKANGTEIPQGVLLGGVDNAGALSPVTEDCGDNSATEVDALRVRPSSGSLQAQGRIILFGVARRVTV